MMNPTQTTQPRWVNLLSGLLVVGIIAIPLERYWEVNAELRGAPDAPLVMQREIAFYQERAGRAPKDGLDLAALAATYLKVGRVTGGTSWYLLAEQAAQRSLANLPFDNYGAILVLAKVSEEKHEFPKAIDLAQQVLKAKPRDEGAQSILVTSNLAMGNLSEARREAQKLAQRIENLDTHTLRALVAVAEGQDQAALVDFKKAISLEEAGEPYGSAWARTLWGRFLARRGHFVEAQQRYEEALKVLPGYPLALVQLGELETRTGQYARAEAHYNQVLARTQGAAQVFDHLVLRGLANLSYLKGDRPGTKNLLDRAEARLRHDMNAFGHRRELARLLLERGRPQDLGEVLSLMKVELTLRRDPETWDTQAWALMRAGRWSEAHQAMAAALKGGLRDASIFYRAGVIATQLEDTASAQQYFQQMRSTDPHFDANARQALGLVELNL